MSDQDYLFDLSPRTASLPSLPPRLSPGTWTYRVQGKKAVDILFVLLLMPVLLPLICILSLLVASDGASPFFVQERVGKGGRVFRMWKLRTMVPDAEARLAAYLATSPAARAEWEVKQKLADDPRITRVGKVLRRTSLDELPQFFNVLTGDMSVVGPRPMMVGQERLYPGKCYFDLRPGVTGNWQVSDRNCSAFADRARFDDSYHRDLSIRTDLRLISKTVHVVLRATGC